MTTFPINPVAARRRVLVGALYTMFVATAVWFAVFLTGVFAYHYGVVGLHDIAPRHLGWLQTLDASAWIAGIAASMVLAMGTVLVMLMALMVWAYAKIQKHNSN